MHKNSVQFDEFIENKDPTSYSIRGRNRYQKAENIMGICICL
jgi:hypothetical protein